MLFSFLKTEEPTVITGIQESVSPIAIPFYYTSRTIQNPLKIKIKEERNKTIIMKRSVKKAKIQKKLHPTPKRSHSTNPTY